ncbi:MAG: tRNA1(Val) (adenine(37)-N6)-methyltransferase [Lachnospiraceae bacterium]|nr:tRNA1(Val) (adenine(37)-N6)-methyltransferase [Lachnospiraceae bacterium]
MANRETFIKGNERAVDLQRSNLWLLQDPERFCFGMDAVLLSAYTEIKAGERCLDMGTGTGILPLLLSAKTDAAELVGLEIQPESADMARRSVAMNIALRGEDAEAETPAQSANETPASAQSRPVRGRVRIEEGDLKEASAIFGRGSFDVVTCNPPYMTGGHGIVNPADAKAIARHEILCTLDDVCREAAAVLVPGGRFYMVHRPFRLAEIFATAAKYNLEPKRMRLVYPYKDREPNMVLIGFVRGGRPRIEVEKPLILWEREGEYTEEVKESYGF